MEHPSACIAFLLLFGGSGCADPSRLDAVEAGLAGVRARGVLHDRQIEWLRWGQTVLAERGGSAEGRATLMKRIAALEAENAALLQRVERVERLDPVERARPASSPVASIAPSLRPAHTRTLDEKIPYEQVRCTDDGCPPAAPPAQPVQRILDETVPY